MKSQRSTVTSHKLVPAKGPYSYGVSAGGWIFTSGMTGEDANGLLVGTTAGRPDVEAQSLQALQNLLVVLQGLDASFGNVAKLNAYTTDLRYLDLINARCREFFRPPYPARAIHGKGLALEDSIIMFEATGATSGTPREIRSSKLANRKLPSAQGGTQVGEVIFSNGHSSFDVTGKLVGRGDVRVQVEQALDNIGATLEEGGLDFSDVIKINVSIPDWYGFAQFNEIYRMYFRDPFPARAVIQAILEDEGMLVEIEVVAARGGVKRIVDSEVAGGSRFTLKRRADTIYLKELFPTRSPYAHAVQVGDLVYLCGQIGFDASNRLVGPSDIRAQTRKTMENHEVCLRALGGKMEDIVKTNITVTDYRLIPGFHEEYAKCFSPPYPAQTTVVAGLARDQMVLEIEAIAVLGAAQNAVFLTGPEM